MQLKLKDGIDWHKALRRMVRNPAIEVIAAIVLVLLAAWIVIETETEHRANTLFPIPVSPR